MPEALTLSSTETCQKISAPGASRRPIAGGHRGWYRALVRWWVTRITPASASRWRAGRSSKRLGLRTPTRNTRPWLSWRLTSNRSTAHCGMSAMDPFN